MSSASSTSGSSARSRRSSTREHSATPRCSSRPRSTPRTRTARRSSSTRTPASRTTTCATTSSTSGSRSPSSPTRRLGLDGTLDVMAAKTGAESIRQLPTIKLFKIRMDLENEPGTEALKTAGEAVEPMELDPITLSDDRHRGRSAPPRARWRCARTPTRRRPNGWACRSRARAGAPGIPARARRPAPRRGDPLPPPRGLQAPTAWACGPSRKARSSTPVAGWRRANSMAVFAGTDPRNGCPVRLSRDARRRHRAAADQGRQGRRSGRNHEHLEPEVEAIEPEYPLRVEEYRLIPDSGGAGTTAAVSGCAAWSGRRHLPVQRRGERFSYRPWGLFGGESGGSGQFLIIEADESSAAPSTTSRARSGSRPNRRWWSRPRAPAATARRRSAAPKRSPKTGRAAGSRPSSCAGTTTVTDDRARGHGRIVGERARRTVRRLRDRVSASGDRSTSRPSWVCRK